MFKIFAILFLTYFAKSQAEFLSFQIQEFLPITQDVAIQVSSKSASDDIQEILDFFQGLTTSGKIEYEAMKQCVLSEKDLLPDFMSAIEKLKNKNILSGLTELAKVIYSMYKEPQCQVIKDQVADLVVLILEFTTSPVQVAKNMYAHKDQIEADINVFIDSVKELNFKQAGNAIVDILKLSVLKSSFLQMNYQVTPASVLIIEGILYGFGSAASASFQGCLSDDEVIMTDVYQAVLDFQKGDAASQLAGLILLSKIAKEIPAAINECKIVVSDLKELELAIATLSSPMEFFYHVGKDIVVNRVQLYTDVQNCVADYEQSLWFDFGASLGNALDKLLVGSQISP